MSHRLIGSFKAGFLNFYRIQVPSYDSLDSSTVFKEQVVILIILIDMARSFCIDSLF